MRKNRQGTACVILAGGLGTRMKSGLPKVLHPIAGRPMITYAIDAALSLNPEKCVVVVGAMGETIKEALSGYAGKLIFAVQKKPLGTAHALSAGLAGLKSFRGGIMVLNGDGPLLKSSTLKKFLSLHRRAGNALSLASFIAKEPGSYGRIVRDGSGLPLRIVEKSDLTDEESNIDEVNSGLYLMEPETVGLLEKVKPNPGKKEYYLTDILALAGKSGLKTGVYPIAPEEEFAGVNTYSELRLAEDIIRGRLIAALAGSGVKFLHPGLTFIDATVEIAPGSLIYPNTYIQGCTKIGKGCIIYPNVRIIDCVLEEGAIIKDSSLMEGSRICKSAQVGPFAHIRPGSVIRERAKIGNFVEVKKSVIGEGTKAQHLSYIGDSTVGKDVNIGAGTITCNYDGVKKHQTVIGDGVFIGSDTQLIAPVKVGKGSYVGAGSTIRRNVPAGSLGISRAEQKNIKGWARKREKRKGSSK